MIRLFAFLSSFWWVRSHSSAIRRNKLAELVREDYHFRVLLRFQAFSVFQKIPVSASSQIPKLFRHLAALGIAIWFMSQCEVHASCGDYLHHPGANATNRSDLARDEAILRQALENRKKEHTDEPTSTCQSGRCNGSPISPLQPLRIILPQPSIHSECSSRIEIELERSVGHCATDSTKPLQPLLEITLPPPRAS